MKHIRAVLIEVALVLFGLTILAGVAVAQPKPAVTAAFSDPYWVAGSGGSTTFISHERNATDCYVTVLRPKGIVSHTAGTKNCHTGLYTGDVDLKANPGTHKRYVELEVYASGATGTFWIAQYGKGVAPAPVRPSTTSTTFPVVPVAPPSTVPSPSAPVVPPVAPSTTSLASTSTTTAEVTPSTATTVPATTTTVAPPASTTSTTSAPTTTVPPTTVPVKPPCPPPCHTDNGRGNDGCNGGNDSHDRFALVSSPSRRRCQADSGQGNPA